MIQDIVQFFTELLSTWQTGWGWFTVFLDSLAQFGIGDGKSRRARYYVEMYGERTATPTTQLFGIIYIIAKFIPTFMLVFIFLRRKFDKRKSILGGIIGQILISYTMINVLNVRPHPVDIYEKLAYGPYAVITSVYKMFTQQPVEAFTVWVVILGVFILLSFLLWYSINLIMWAVTISFREEPMFANTSAKGHAAWLTVVWIFFLSMEPAGSAFISTLFVLIAIIANRAWKKREISLPGSTEQSDADKIVEAIETKEDTSEESSGDSSIQWE